MSEADKDSKTELPSEKRLNEAFEEGRFAKSAELQVVATLAAMLGVIGFFCPPPPMPSRRWPPLSGAT